MSGQGRGCCHFTLQNEETSLELLAALSNSELLPEFCLTCSSGSLLSACSHEISDGAHTEFVTVQRRGLQREIGGRQRFAIELHV